MEDSKILNEVENKLLDLNEDICEMSFEEVNSYICKLCQFIDKARY